MRPTASNESIATPPAIPESSWFEQPKNINRMIAGLVLFSILLVLSELLYTNEHIHFAWEEIWGFHAWFGFVAFVVIVFLGRVLRMFVSRKERYYDR
jgi:uncharacterized membrane protein YbhN (UPF0104 family)